MRNDDLKELLTPLITFSNVEDYQRGREWAERAYQRGQHSRDPEIQRLRNAYTRVLSQFNGLGESIQQFLSELQPEPGCDCSACEAVRLLQRQIEVER